LSAADFRLRTSDLRVLIVGVSARAAAESAARAGFAVTAIDAFGDLDQHPSVQAHPLEGNFSPDAASRLAATIESEAVAYLANYENHPDAVVRLAQGRALWGNAPDVLERVRDPLLLTQRLRRRGFAVPEVSVESQIPNPKSLDSVLKWLVKPRASGGGHRVRLWRRGSRVPRGCYLQEFIEGTPGSVVFVAAGGRAVPLGVSRQLIGEEPFGASGYRYCGNMLVAAGEDDAVVAAACALAGAVCEEFGLVGVNGIDFVAKQSVPYAIEVNPRWCASMELVERAFGLSVFGAHAAACRDGLLPDFDLASARRMIGVVGKAVVFARHDVVVGDTRAWLAEGTSGDVRDVPHPGARIGAGRPVCTVFATARDEAECHASLVRQAERVYTQLTRFRQHGML
jgi:predicted ATP-grasp superfamily ATP-dependent carboligase